MEKNTVLLSLYDYNELREIKEKIESGKIAKINYYSHGSHCIEYLSPVEALEEVVDLNNYYKEMLEDRDSEIKELKNPTPKIATEKEEDEKEFKEVVEILKKYMMQKNIGVIQSL